MTISKIAALAALVALLSLGTHAQTVFPPQGRLTLTSNAPVMTSDVVGATAIYYTAYQGSYVPIYNPSSATWAAPSCVGTLTLSSTYQTAGNVYDVFALTGSPCVIAFGPAWNSTTARDTSCLTTGTKLQAVAGIWTNACGANNFFGYKMNNGSTTYTPNATAGTYLGSVYITVSGETTVNLKPSPANGGGGNFVGLWNAYNRVPVDSLSRDSSGSYSYSSTTWHEMNTSTNNSISWVDGLGQSSVNASLKTMVGVSTAAAQMNIGVTLDSTTTAPNIYATSNAPTSTIGDNYQTIFSEESFPPQMGFHYVQAMESAGSGVSGTFYPNAIQTLHLRLDY